MPNTSRLWSVLSISLLFVAAAAPALAQVPPCPVDRDAFGNCQVTRTDFGIGKIAQLAYKPGNDVVTLKAHGIDDQSDDVVDALMFEVVFAPGGYTRWRSQPGVSLGFMTSGRLTVYTSHGSKGCTQEFAERGTPVPGFVELPAQVAAIHNEGPDNAVVLVLRVKRETDPFFTTREDQPVHASCPIGFNP